MMDELVRSKGDENRLARDLLKWYRENGRSLPWRDHGPGGPDPYRIWLSEVMLQQTTVATVLPRYERFLSRWPRIQDLAAADLDAVLSEWAGLGYYARARNLHKCARVIVEEHGGIFPRSRDALLSLPGIGEYTAAAIGAILHDAGAPVVDGNVERVIARLFAVQTPLPKAKPELRRLAARLTPGKRRGDYAQAVMDLGATVCVPQNPRCHACPVKGRCRAFAAGIAAALPRRAPKNKKPTRHGAVFVVRTGAGEMLLRRRPDRGLLGGMMEFPGTAWRDEEVWRVEEALEHAPLAADWREAGSVRHTFTHFHLELRVFYTSSERFNPQTGAFYSADEIGELALPSLMKKVLRAVDAP